MITRYCYCEVCKITVMWEDVNFIQRKEVVMHLCDECYNKHIVSEYNRIKEDI